MGMTPQEASEAECWKAKAEFWQNKALTYGKMMLWMQENSVDVDDYGSMVLMTYYPEGKGRQTIKADTLYECVVQGMNKEQNDN